MQNVQVMTTSGTVEGFSRDGVTRWRSIPYARPPVGRLRFRAPQPPLPWSGVLHCHEFASCAPQHRLATMIGINKYQSMSEDCLTLNVVAPATPTNKPLPVMFFMHGGGPIGSSATPVYDGAGLARRGCVYVSANYRIGALGHLDLSSLSTPKTPIDSNLYLRDLVSALRWVQDNILAFGGDPANVTIFGESAGGHAVATLLAVPEAGGLFARAIAQSAYGGMVRSPETSARYAAQFCSLLGVDVRDGAAAVKRAEPAQLMAALNRLISQTMRDRPGDPAPIGATIDEDYLPRHPFEAMACGEAHPVPLIVGHTADEAKLFHRFGRFVQFPTTRPHIERSLVDVDPALREQIVAAYPSYPHPSACVQLGGDMCFGSASWQIAQAHHRHAPTYLQRHDYAPRILAWLGLGATHGVDLLALFDVYRTKFGSVLTAAGDQRSARRVSDDMQSRWLAFSRTGVPGPGWPAYSEDRAVMIFDRVSRLEFDPDSGRRQAWEGFTPAIDAARSPTSPPGRIAL